MENPISSNLNTVYLLTELKSNLDSRVYEIENLQRDLHRKHLENIQLYEKVSNLEIEVDIKRKHISLLEENKNEIKRSSGLLDVTNLRDVLSNQNTRKMEFNVLQREIESTDLLQTKQYRQNSDLVLANKKLKQKIVELQGNLSEVTATLKTSSAANESVKQIYLTDIRTLYAKSEENDHLKCINKQLEDKFVEMQNRLEKLRNYITNIKRQRQASQASLQQDHEEDELRSQIEQLALENISLKKDIGVLKSRLSNDLFRTRKLQSNSRPSLPEMMTINQRHHHQSHHQHQRQSTNDDDKSCFDPNRKSQYFIITSEDSDSGEVTLKNTDYDQDNEHSNTYICPLIDEEEEIRNNYSTSSNEQSSGFMSVSEKLIKFETSIGSKYLTKINKGSNSPLIEMRKHQLDQSGLEINERNEAQKIKEIKNIVSSERKRINRNDGEQGFQEMSKSFFHDKMAKFDCKIPELENEIRNSSCNKNVKTIALKFNSASQSVGNVSTISSTTQRNTERRIKRSLNIDELPEINGIKSIMEDHIKQQEQRNCRR